MLPFPSGPPPTPQAFSGQTRPCADYPGDPAPKPRNDGAGGRLLPSSRFAFLSDANVLLLARPRKALLPPRRQDLHQTAVTQLSGPSREPTMRDKKAFIRNHLPHSLAHLLRTLLPRKKPPAPVDYASITLTNQDLELGTYKKYLGGGSRGWESRGAFQLHFLREMGMQENSSVLDVGCGPGRAARHLIGYLEAGGYCGVDYNPDFIKAASAMATSNGMTSKHPTFWTVEDFDFEGIDRTFDYAIAFSVLNHCTIEQREKFFGRLPGRLKEGGKAYISHAGWFDGSYIRKSSVRRTNKFGSGEFDITRFGWHDPTEIFPIIELTKHRP